MIELTLFQQMTYVFQQEFGLYILLAAIVFGFVLSFAVGANDSANSWGTPVGAGTISLGVAFFLGSIMETLGSVFLSGEVVSTVAGPKSVLNMDLFRSNLTEEEERFRANETILLKEQTLILGLVSSMVASQVWQLSATYLTWPVSGTHTIISALMGFTLVEHGARGVNIGNPNIFEGSGVFKVIYGLLVSPALTLVLSFGFYYFLYKTVVKGKPKSWLSKLTITSCVFLTFLAIGFTASAMPAMPVPDDVHKKLFGLAIGTAVGLVAGLVFLLGVLPFLYVPEEDPVITLDRELSRQLSRSRHPSITSTNSRRLRHTEEDFVDETEEVKRIFRPLQLLTACFGALSHGSNDVGNCIGPLVTVWYIFQTPVNYSTTTPLYGVLLWGGIGISLGMVCCGSRVIETMGSKISRMTPSLGFTVVLTASVVVMVCSMAGIPTSTTHCQVMGVVGAGVAKGWIDTGSFKRGVKTINFSLMRNIGLSWLVTIPFAMALSAVTYAAARALFIGWAHV